MSTGPLGPTGPLGGDPVDPFPEPIPDPTPDPPQPVQRQQNWWEKFMSWLKRLFK